MKTTTQNVKFSFFRNNAAFQSIASSIISIVVGLVIGFIILLVLNPSNAMYGFSRLLTAGLKDTSRIGKVLYSAAPLLMTGLAVAFAFKTGLFNIGAPGQYLMGAFVALFCAIVLKLPWYVDIILAAIGGAIWGFIPGFFKAYLGINEVITSIMFNWIGLFIVNLLVANTPAMLSNTYGGSDSSRTVNIIQVNESGLIPDLGLKAISPYMNISIFLAIIIAISMFVVLTKTTFGYELVACGSNKDASKYAGINEKKNIILAMVISGALAGIGGAFAYLAGTTNYQVIKSLQATGFNGIPVALLANSNPIGVIFSAIFISYINIGGDAMQPEFAKENIDIIISVIIYLSAFSLVIKEFLSRSKKSFKKIPDKAIVSKKEGSDK